MIVHFLWYWTVFGFSNWIYKDTHSYKYLIFPIVLNISFCFSDNPLYCAKIPPSTELSLTTDSLQLQPPQNVLAAFDGYIVKRQANMRIPLFHFLLLNLVRHPRYFHYSTSFGVNRSERRRVKRGQSVILSCHSVYLQKETFALRGKLRLPTKQHKLRG